MAKAQRPTQEDLQRDEVAQSLQETFDAIHRNRKPLIAAAVVLILVLIVFGAVRSHRTTVRIESNRLLSDALQSYEQLPDITDETQREQTMDVTLAALDQLTASYGNTPLGAEALFLKGRTLYRDGQYEEAQKAYEQYIAAADSDFQRARGYIALAYAHENGSFFQPNEEAQRSELDAALVNFERAENTAPANSFLRYYALLGQARYYELTGNNENAIALLERVVNERPAPETPSVDRSMDETDAAKDDLTARLEAILDESESQASLQATAKLRLDRLRAKAGLEVPTPITVVETAGTDNAEQQPETEAPAGSAPNLPATSDAASTPAS